MIRSIVYIFPLLVNCLTGGILFFAPHRLSQLGCGGILVGGVIAAWSFLYALTSIIVGRFVTERNAVPMIMTAAAMLGCAYTGFLTGPNIPFIFTLICLMGVGNAFYCTSFQLFMKSLESDEGGGQGLVRPTALYTTSWSIGIACGPFFYGALGERACFLICIGLSVVIFGGVYAVWRLAPVIRERNRALLKGKDGGQPELDYLKFPSCLLLGWLSGGIGSFAVWTIRAMEPYRAHALAFTESDTAYILALLCGVQAVTAFLLVYGRTWMYRAFQTALVGISGVLGLLLFAFGTSVFSFYAAAVFYGIFSGCTYFYFVFFALARKDSARCLSINETIVGSVGVFGPLVGGLFADMNTSYPFVLCAVLVFLALAFHTIRVRQLMRKASKSV